MIKIKLLDFWGSLQTNEKKIIKIALFLLPLIMISIYLGDISKKISAKKLNLEIAKTNFEYVYDKALNYQKYTLAQNALSEYPEINDFIFAESKLYPLIEFQLGEEEGAMFVSFKSKSAVNYSQFFESLVNHPGIKIVSVSITPYQELYQVKAFIR